MKLIIQDHQNFDIAFDDIAYLVALDYQTTDKIHIHPISNNRETEFNSKKNNKEHTNLSIDFYEFD